MKVHLIIESVDKPVLPGGHMVPAIDRLRRLIKAMLRAYGWQVVTFKEINE